MKQEGWHELSNLHPETIENPSYSMMHSLSGGYSIIFFSSTHKRKSEAGILHQQNAVRVVTCRDMCAFWHERCYHGGAKSRFSKDRSAGRVGFHLSKDEADKSPSRTRESPRDYEHLEDLRLFGYIWNESGKIFRTR